MPHCCCKHHAGQRHRPLLSNDVMAFDHNSVCPISCNDINMVDSDDINNNNDSNSSDKTHAFQFITN